MLADFGTADVDEETLGARWASRSTTLENTPPELLLGGAAVAHDACAPSAWASESVRLLSGQAPRRSRSTRPTARPTSLRVIGAGAALHEVGAPRDGALRRRREQRAHPDTLSASLVMLGPRSRRRRGRRRRRQRRRRRRLGGVGGERGHGEVVGGQAGYAKRPQAVEPALDGCNSDSLESWRARADGSPRPDRQRCCATRPRTGSTPSGGGASREALASEFFASAARRPPPGRARASNRSGRYLSNVRAAPRTRGR